jgi:hypothetical protein
MSCHWTPARLMHDHVNVLPTTMVAAQTANQSPHDEVRPEPLGERCRAEDGRVPAFEADRPNVQSGTNLVDERGGWSLGRFHVMRLTGSGPGLALV